MVSRWGEKKSYGWENLSLGERPPMRAIGITGGGSRTEAYTGAPGVVRAVPPVMAPAQGVCVNIAPRWPTAMVQLVPSVMSANRVLLLRANTPSLVSGSLVMVYKEPKQAA